MESQFTMIRQSQSSTYDVPYDYSSVMHYGKSAFSKDRKSITIQPLQSKYLNVIGRVKDVSANDLLKVNRMYGCNGNYASGGGGQDTTIADIAQPTTTPTPIESE